MATTSLITNLHTSIEIFSFNLQKFSPTTGKILYKNNDQIEAERAKKLLSPNV